MTSLPGQPDHASIGDYRLLALIGEGGMGVVHLAQAPDGRRVALKVLRPHVVGDSEARERLAREVSSLRRITSPRIAEILDADPHGPTPYVVTRYVPGLSLYHHVEEEGPIEGGDLLHFADGLAQALQAVHDVGVLHRDIKPTNVLMEGRSPVLIDFGLARVAEDPRLTHTGWLLGTPGYLAPEVLYGDDATVASDVHAWAATVVFAATGRPPYGKGPVMAVLDRVRRGEHDLSGVPVPLRGLVEECLAPEPLDRPSLIEIRAWTRRQREEQHIATTRGVGRRAPVPEQWTMPVAPHAAPHPPPPVTADVPGDPQPHTPRDQPAMLAAEPFQQPPPIPDRADDAPLPSAAADPPTTRVLPAEPQRPVPWAAPVAPVPPPSKAQRVLQLLGLGALTASAVAYAPYLGTALVGLVLLVMRTASVTRQRHGRRRMIRGRPRWYDVPTTAMSTPGYVVLALFGALTDLALAAIVALAAFSFGYLAGQPVEVRLLLAGIAFAPALWWGPGSGRLREMTRGLVLRAARTEYWGWFVAVMAGLGAAVLLGLLLSEGPNWAPALGAPWT